MRILLIASGKCGSNALAEALCDHHSLTLINEPFNWSYDDRPDLNVFNVPNNSLVKIIPSANQYPQADFEDWYDFIDWFTCEFDEVYVLDRVNKAEQLMSVLHAHKTGQWSGKYEFAPFTMYKEDTPIIEDFFFISKMIKYCSLGADHDIKYEHLFNVDSAISYSALPIKGLYDKYFNPSLKHMIV